MRQMDELLPSVRDHDLEREFFEAADAGELLLQRCASCEAVQFYPRTLCSRCSSPGVEWVPSSRQGVVYSRTECFRPTAPGDDEHFILMLVELDESPRVLCRLAADEPMAAIGDRVSVAFQRYGPERDQIQLIGRHL